MRRPAVRAGDVPASSSRGRAMSRCPAGEGQRPAWPGPSDQWRKHGPERLNSMRARRTASELWRARVARAVSAVKPAIPRPAVSGFHPNDASRSRVWARVSRWPSARFDGPGRFHEQGRPHGCIVHGATITHAPNPTSAAAGGARLAEFGLISFHASCVSRTCCQVDRCVFRYP